MCIGSNSVNQAQDLMIETKIEDLPNSLLPNGHQGHFVDKKSATYNVSQSKSKPPFCVYIYRGKNRHFTQCEFSNGKIPSPAG